MALVDKIEEMVFVTKSLSSIEIVKDKQVVVRMRCLIEKLTEDEIHLLSASGTHYQIYGKNLQVREYGDSYIKIAGDTVSNVAIAGEKDE